jgi:methionyl-tRNA formyltransferase
LARYPERAINLHISYLPWNRGADPNLWSWIDGTLKGVTIHFLDAGIDTGPVLVQEQTSFDEGETLASSYFRLRDHIERMFAESWPRIRLGQIPAHPQPPGGSLHRKGDATKILDRLPLGYETPVADLRGLAETAK